MLLTKLRCPLKVGGGGSVPNNTSIFFTFSVRWMDALANFKLKIGKETNMKNVHSPNQGRKLRGGDLFLPLP